MSMVTMIHSAVTVSLVEEARGGPFVLWDDLPAACELAAKLGYDAIELFAPSANAVDSSELKSLLEQHELKLAAVGTGAGMVIDGLSLIDTDRARREIAIEFVRSMIEFGSEFGAPAIIGSMQGKWGQRLDKKAAIDLLRDSLDRLGTDAEQHGTRLIYEPLNRYETNLINTMADGVAFLKTLKSDNVKLLADLFHMNIEEENIADGLRAGNGFIGHVHFVDSNRRPAGNGHMNFEPIAAALKEIDYQGYASAEAFPWPDSKAAAEQTMAQFKKWFRD